MLSLVSGVDAVGVDVVVVVIGEVGVVVVVVVEVVVASGIVGVDWKGFALDRLP